MSVYINKDKINLYIMGVQIVSQIYFETILISLIDI